MIRAFRFDNNHILQTEEPIDTLKANAWFDLIEPTQEEDNRIVNKKRLNLCKLAWT